MNSTTEAVGSILLKKKDTRPQQSVQEECTEKYVGLDKWNGIGLGLLGLCTFTYSFLTKLLWTVWYVATYPDWEKK